MNPFSIKQNLEAIAPVLPTDGLLVAISGGMDSVVLAQLCKLEGYSIELAHCNFQLRDEESVRDENFVRQLATTWNIPLHVQRFDTITYATAKKCSIQEAARTLRYEWFATLLTQFPHLKWTLTAHHKDDQAETLLMNFLRGTGLSGLTGIPARNGRVLRPLLPVERATLEKFTLENQLSFVVDSSNQKEEYTRNYFRHTIIPALQQVYPTVTTNLIDNQERFTKIEKLYQQLVRVQINKLVKENNGEFAIAIASIAQFEHTSLLYEILHPYGFSSGQVVEANKLMRARTGAQLFASAGNWRLVKHRNWLLLSPQHSKDADFIMVSATQKIVEFAAGKLTFRQVKKVDRIDLTTPTIALLDSKLLEFPLQLRRWRAGDYFYPLGMSKKKKLARLFIDLKLSLPEKEKVWVLSAGDKIVWVIGIRIDERFKLTAKSQEAILIEYSLPV
ncbi:MAG: tRNA lysidine(34) synthetase TilS [Bacteroidetes bacterium]|nr:tRNA lysidine(34) synthetase TilS [Bacteroidota bacterium]